MKNSPFRYLGAVLELSLCELHKAEARAVGIGCEHAGRDEVGKAIVILVVFNHLVPPSRKAIFDCSG
jgi:hypothetical protein